MKRTDAIALTKKLLEQLESLPPAHDDELDFEILLNIFAGRHHARLEPGHPAVQNCVSAFDCRYQRPGQPSVGSSPFHVSLSQDPIGGDRVVTVYHGPPVAVNPRDLVESL